jgi:predicted secreted hydrolase
MGRNGWTYWYALTRMSLEGTLTMDDRDHNVAGTGWLDRQWGNWNWMGFGGWKWFAIQLEDGREVVAYHIQEPVSLRPILRLCQVVAVDGSHRIWYDLEVKDLGSWTSPDSKEIYTNGWRIGSPSARLDLEITPAFSEQEIHRSLWEGSCSAEGSMGDERVSGVAFVELNTGRPAPTPVKYLSYLKTIGVGVYERMRRGSPA